MRIIAISDTHTAHESVVLPEYQPCDVLVHAGDITNRGEVITIQRFAYWAQQLPYEHVIVIAGNHDFCFENANALMCETFLKEKGITYLRDEACTINGIKFYGSPWQPWFHNWAFNLQRGEEIAAKWAAIPDDTDVLLTHGPASNNLGGLISHVFHRRTQTDLYDEDVGCEDLFNRLKELSNLKYHIHGHIHEGWGIHDHPEISCKCVNASIMDAAYKPVNKPWILPIT